MIMHASHELHAAMLRISKCTLVVMKLYLHTLVHESLMRLLNSKQAMSCFLPRATCAPRLTPSFTVLDFGSQARALLVYV